VVFAVQTLVKESALVRETKDKQISELKKMVDDSNESQRNEYEKRVSCFAKLVLSVKSARNNLHILQACQCHSG
jgi:hypothetical protein